MISYFYINSIKAYLGDNSESLNRIKILPLISAGAGAIMMLIYVIFDINYFVVTDVPFVTTKNLYMQAIGGFNPPGRIKFLSLLLLISTLASSWYFFRYIYKSGRREILLTVGIVADFFILANDLIPSIVDVPFVLPVIFLANIFEILRITHANQMELGNKVKGMHEELIHSSRLSEAGNYYAGLAHEILNPLFAAKGYFKLLLVKLETDKVSNVTHYIQQIEKQHERIESLALNVREYTKIGSTEEAIVCLNTIISDSIETINLKASVEGVRINYLSTENSVFFNCRKNQFVQVITNLLNNAIEAIKEEDEKWINIQIKPAENDQIVISISDSGKGIAPHLRDKIWDRRFTTKKNGSGLGLNICKDIILNHGGAILLNDESHHTEFLIRLPVLSV